MANKAVLTEFSSHFGCGKRRADRWVSKRTGRHYKKVPGEVSLAFAAFILCQIWVTFEAFVMEVKLTAAVINQPQTFQRRL